ncbi:hypothetical protein HDU97_008897 [Phlyctochytrium planicorne]|nr:hypothetical protein HDU97_008897 [Phlyctochytrium planicorne]
MALVCKGRKLHDLQATLLSGRSMKVIDYRIMESDNLKQHYPSQPHPPFQVNKLPTKKNMVSFTKIFLAVATIFAATVAAAPVEAPVAVEARGDVNECRDWRHCK